MTDLQHRKTGFSFIEIMLALFLMATLLTAVMGLSQTTVTALFDYSQRLQRIFLLEETLFDITYAQLQHKPFYTKAASGEPIKKTGRQQEGSPTKLSYRIVPISDKSSLKQFKDDLEMYHIKAEWNSLYSPREEIMIALFLKNKDEKK